MVSDSWRIDTPSRNKFLHYKSSSTPRPACRNDRAFGPFSVKRPAHAAEFSHPSPQLPLLNHPANFKAFGPTFPSSDFSQTRGRSIANSINVATVWLCRSCRGTTCRAPTADPQTSSFMSSHAPDLGCGSIACEQDGLAVLYFRLGCSRSRDSANPLIQKETNR